MLAEKDCWVQRGSYNKFIGTYKLNFIIYSNYLIIKTLDKYMGILEKNLLIFIALIFRKTSLIILIETVLYGLKTYFIKFTTPVCDCYDICHSDIEINYRLLYIYTVMIYVTVPYNREADVDAFEAEKAKVDMRDRVRDVQARPGQVLAAGMAAASQESESKSEEWTVFDEHFEGMYTVMYQSCRGKTPHLLPLPLTKGERLQ